MQVCARKGWGLAMIGQQFIFSPQFIIYKNEGLSRINGLEQWLDKDLSEHFMKIKKS